MIDPDHGQALGAVKLRSLGNLKALRKGDRIEITGEVDHRIKDIYDFNDDTFFDNRAFRSYRLLAQEGYAKPFEVRGSKKQKIIGTLDIKNGRIIASKFRWEGFREYRREVLSISYDSSAFFVYVFVFTKSITPV